MTQPILIQADNRVFLEAVPGVWSYLSTLTAWNALSNDGKQALVNATYDRLGIKR